MSVTANIINITRCSLHDGRGIRTVVFFKGCNLRCAWCHNPESQRMKNEVFLNLSRCIACRRCITEHPDCYSIQNDALTVDRQHCVGCGSCANRCPSNAIEMAAKAMTVDQVFAEVKKDQLYYERSGGGVTFSGGECLLFPEFLTEILKTCRDAGIHTAIETAFCVPWEIVEPLIPLVDTFLIDIKHMNSAVHMQYTGQGNERILENLQKLARIHSDILVRVPMIPTVNADLENLLETVRFCRSLGSAVIGVELLRYNNLSEPKYRSLDQNYQSFSAQPQTEEEMRAIVDTLCSAVEAPNWVFFK